MSLALAAAVLAVVDAALAVHILRHRSSRVPSRPDQLEWWAAQRHNHDPRKKAR